jgi:hypothetical protein
MAMLAVSAVSPFFGRGSRFGAHAGLLITSAIVSSSPTRRPPGDRLGWERRSLMIFLRRVAGYRLRSETGALGLIVLVGIAATAVVRLFFAVDTAECSVGVRRHRRDRRTGCDPRRHLEATAPEVAGAAAALINPVAPRATVPSRLVHDALRLLARRNAAALAVAGFLPGSCGGGEALRTGTGRPDGTGPASPRTTPTLTAPTRTKSRQPSR